MIFIIAFTFWRQTKCRVKKKKGQRFFWWYTNLTVKFWKKERKRRRRRKNDCHLCLGICTCRDLHMQRAINSSTDTTVYHQCHTSISSIECWERKIKLNEIQTKHRWFIRSICLFNINMVMLCSIFLDHDAGFIVIFVVVCSVWIHEFDLETFPKHLINSQFDNLLDLTFKGVIKLEVKCNKWNKSWEWDITFYSLV